MSDELNLEPKPNQDNLFQGFEFMGEWEEATLTPIKSSQKKVETDHIDERQMYWKW